MPGRTVRIARIAGIPVGVSPLWLVIVALITWSLGSSYFPEQIAGIAAPTAYALGLASALLLFASILAHEFGHALVARRRGIEVEEIDLWLLGGVSRMRGEAHAPGDELRFALAGPAVSAVLAGAFGLATALLPASTPAVLAALVEYQLLINGLLLVFNLIPAFPLDGGRVLRALLWRRSGDMRSATETAARVGRAFGYLLVVLGVVEFLVGSPEGLWLVLIGFFIVTAARAQALGIQAQAALAGVRASALMSAPAASIPGRISAAHAASEYFLPQRYSFFAVTDEQGRALGIVSLSQIERLAPERREHVSVSELAARDAALFIGEQDEVAGLLERPAFARMGHVVVVDALRRPAGVISTTDLERALRAAKLAGRQGGPGRQSPGGRAPALR